MGPSWAKPGVRVGGWGRTGKAWRWPDGVNVRPLRTHNLSGLGTLIKNSIMFVPDPSSYHANACEKLGAIWHLPHVKGKTRLNVPVMLTPQFHSTGPHHFSKGYPLTDSASWRVVPAAVVLPVRGIGGSSEG